MLASIYDLMTDRRNRWQLLFWLIVFLEAPVSSYLGHVAFSPGESTLMRLVGMVTKIAAAYLLAYYLIPKLLFRRRYLLFLTGSFLAAVVLSVTARALNIYVAEAILFPGQPNESLLQVIGRPLETLNIYLGRFLSVALWFLFVKLGVDQLRGQRQMAELEQEKTTAELRFLKAQIHPHFLFNTLNNLYTLTLEKSDEAPEVVMKLSRMLDYVLYQCRSPRVTLREEVALIENYLGLETLRYGERLRLDFQHQIDNPAALISPLILLCPVENAFKHGVSGTFDAPRVSLLLTVKNETLHFRVRNSKPPTPVPDGRHYTSGIGLENIRRQLDLTYPDRHEIAIRDEDRTFTIDLHLQL